MFFHPPSKGDITSSNIISNDMRSPIFKARNNPTQVFVILELYVINITLIMNRQIHFQ